MLVSNIVLHNKSVLKTREYINLLDVIYIIFAIHNFLIFQNWGKVTYLCLNFLYRETVGNRCNHYKEGARTSYAKNVCPVI